MWDAIFYRRKELKSSDHSVRPHGAITWPLGRPQAGHRMSWCRGDAFKTLQAEINVGGKEETSSSKTISPQSHFLFMSGRC